MSGANAQHTDVEEQDATNAYQSLAETTGLDDPRWAFGAGVEQVQAEISTEVPPDVTPEDLAEYCLMLGDDALIYSHRLSEWVTNAPELEEEVALANTALDLLGQARMLLARAGHVRNGLSGAAATDSLDDAHAAHLADEDQLAYWRRTAEFRCVRLVELDDELDFARCIARLLVFSSWRLALLHRLLDSTDPVIAAVAGKGVKELAYHRDYAVRWALRLGDGTDESHVRMQDAVDWVWPYAEELFHCSGTEKRLAESGVSVNPSDTREEVLAVVAQVIDAATLRRPELPPVGSVAGRGGREGLHTEQLGPLLVQMQSLARELPGATW